MPSLVIPGLLYLSSPITFKRLHFGLNFFSDLTSGEDKFPIASWLRHCTLSQMDCCFITAIISSYLNTITQVGMMCPWIRTWLDNFCYLVDLNHKNLKTSKKINMKILTEHENTTWLKASLRLLHIVALRCNHHNHATMGSELSCTVTIFDLCLLLKVYN